MREILGRAELFQGVDPCVLTALTEQLQPVVFTAGHTVFAQNEPGGQLYIIISGKVKIGIRSPHGQEHLLAVMGPSDMFGELSVFDPGPHTSGAITVTAVRALSMDGSLLRTWTSDQPAHLLRVVARQLRRSDNRLTDRISSDVASRLAKQLLVLAHRFGTFEGDYVRVPHDLTQDELAQLVGASRESVNKALSQFAARGWIRLDVKAVWICDLERLAARVR
ncbi:cAMP-activated global transcriptional regulator CRP [soil metagenome]